MMVIQQSIESPCQIEIVLACFCSPFYVQNGQTALYIASYKGHDQIVELLLRREADVNHQVKVKLQSVFFIQL